MADSNVRVIITGDAAGAIAALKKTQVAADEAAGGMTKSFDKATNDVGNLFTRLGATMGNWGIPFSNSVTNMGKKLDEAKSHGQGFQQAMVDTGGILTGVLAVGAVAVGVESVRMAENFDKAQAILRNSIQNTGGSWKDQQGAIDALNAHTRTLGITDTESEQIQAKLINTTGNYRAGLEYTNTVLDLAAGTHRDATTVAQAFGMALDGNVSRLKRMGIDVGVSSATLQTLTKDTDSVKAAQENLWHVQDEVNTGQIKGSQAAWALSQAHQKLDDTQTKLATDQGAVAEMVDKVTQRFHGDAAAAANTFGGHLDQLKAQFDHVGVAIGNGLIPILSSLAGAFGDVIGWFTQGSTAAHAVEAAIAAVGAALVGAFVVNTVHSAIQSVITALQHLGVATNTNTAEEEANTGATGAMGAAHAEAAAEIEGSSAAMADGEGAAVGMGGGMAAAVGPIALFAAGLAAVGLGLHSVIGGMDTSKINTAVDDFNILNGTTKSTAAGMLEAAGSLDRLTGSTLNFTAAMERSSTYQQAVRLQAQQLAGTQLSLKQSTDSVGQAYQSLVSLQSSGTGSAADLSVAQDNVATSLQQVFLAAGKNADAMTQGQSAAVQARAENDLEYRSLVALAQQYPGLTGQVETYIQQLHLTPPAVKTEITADATQAEKTIQDVQSGIAQIPRTVAVQVDVNKAVGAMAEGGIVGSATLAVIGEAGPEAVIPLSDPARAAEIMSQTGLVQDFSGTATAVPASGGGGGDNFYLTVNAGVWGDAALAGQQIITLIQQAERRQGTRWRQRTSR